MIEGSSDSKISHENLFQIRNLIENLAPAEPKNFIKGKKVHGNFIVNFKFLPKYSQRNIKDLVLHSSISKGTKFSVISLLSRPESRLVISRFISTSPALSLPSNAPSHTARCDLLLSLTRCLCHARSSQLSANSTISTKYHSHPRQLANNIVFSVITDTQHKEYFLPSKGQKSPRGNVNPNEQIAWQKSSVVSNFSINGRVMPDVLGST